MKWYDRVLAKRDDVIPSFMNVDAVNSYVDKSMQLDQPEMTGAETAADIALGFAPVVGTAMGFRDFERARRDDDMLGMGLGILSMLPVGGGAVRAGRKGLGIFGGVAAKNAPKEKMFEAYQRYKADESLSDIYDATGIKMDDIGTTSFEIPDYPSKMRIPPQSLTVGDNISLSDLLDHPELFDNYGDLKNLSVNIRDSTTLKDGARGWYDRYLDSIGLNMDELQDPEQLRSTLLHEVQHAVQRREGMPRGGSLSAGDELKKLSDQGIGEIEAEKIRLRDSVAANKSAQGYDRSMDLLQTSRKLDEIKRLKGYLQDYYQGGSLTNKRRHIFGSGAAIMDHSDEYRMRNSINWAKKHRPKRERNDNYEEYINNAINYAEESLDPALVDAVQAANVASPTAKYQRQIDKVNSQNQPLIENQRTLSQATEMLGKNESPYQSYKNLAGEAEANLVQERMNTPPAMLKSPYDSNTYRKYPTTSQSYVDDDLGLNEGSLLYNALMKEFDSIYKKLGNK